MKIDEVRYDGKWPCLCHGTLIVVIDGKEYNFGKYAIYSGGECGFSDSSYEHSYIDSGEWEWSDARTIPEGYDTDWDEFVLWRINKDIPHGCCGGCL